MDRRTILSVAGLSAAGGLAGCLSTAGQADEADQGDDDAGIVTHSVDDDSVEAAVERITEAIETNDDLSLVAELDHTENAASVGMELPPMVVLLFGNPAAGTPLMQESTTAGLDLPQRLLVWDDDESVQVSYNDPEYIADRHDIEDQDERLENIGAALETIATGSTE